jgi:hypothetical protein
MLRAIPIVLGLTLLAFGGGIPLQTGTGVAAFWPAVGGAPIPLGTPFEHHRYQRLGNPPPGPDWTDTGERFRESETAAPVAVFFHATSGERRYIRLRP